MKVFITPLLCCNLVFTYCQCLDLPLEETHPVHIQYQERQGKYCEGLFRSNSSLVQEYFKVTGFYHYDFFYKCNSDEYITISSSQKGSIRIVGESCLIQNIYRFDAVLNENEVDLDVNTVICDSNVLLRPEEIGFFGWKTYGDTVIFIPLYIQSSEVEEKLEKLHMSITSRETSVDVRFRLLEGNNLQKALSDFKMVTPLANKGSQFFIELDQFKNQLENGRYAIEVLGVEKNTGIPKTSIFHIEL